MTKQMAIASDNAIASPNRSCTVEIASHERLVDKKCSRYLLIRLRSTKPTSIVREWGGLLLLDNYFVSGLLAKGPFAKNSILKFIFFRTRFLKNIVI